MNLDDLMKSASSSRPSFLTGNELLLPGVEHGDVEIPEMSHLRDCDKFANEYLERIGASSYAAIYSKSDTWGFIVRIFYRQNSDINATGTIICWKKPDKPVSISVDSYP